MNSFDVKGLRHFETIIGPLTFACRLRSLPGADRLIVAMRGNCSRDVSAPPVFLDWPEELTDLGHVLKISDPTLFLCDQLEYGTFLGRADADAIEGAVEIAREVASKLGVPHERVLFFGISGGGLAALLAATRLGGSTALAINPQIELRKFISASFARTITEVFEPGCTGAWLVAAHPLRTSLITAVHNARADGQCPRLILLQNRDDARHFEEQYGQFCSAFGIDPSGGRDQSGHLRAVSYNATGGHTALPNPGVVVECIAGALGISTEAIFLRSELRSSESRAHEAEHALRECSDELASVRAALVERTEALVEIRKELERRTRRLQAALNSGRPTSDG